MPCPRCDGFMITHYDDTRCINCGHYDIEVTATPINVMGRPWTPGTCTVCQNAARGTETLCRHCRGKAIAAGMAKRRMVG